ncbi:hypothetical protein D0C36_10615 [Mucilaginibacter conchicola]|uniref:Uncharacterized protein n=1 Tax=Mucilaginibacter conchicola TaxID=2303333 RepID=A0A372NRI8_9SPHI|nr:hypothetical protein D0C36_10615 [Mucilaginibacter conchicola]
MYSFHGELPAVVGVVTNNSSRGFHVGPVYGLLVTTPTRARGIRQAQADRWFGIHAMNIVNKHEQLIINKI